MPDKLKILILEDEPADAELAEAALRRAGIVFRVKRVDSRDGFVSALEEFGPEIILADYHLPAFDGMTALTIAVERAPNVPFIFVSGAMGEELAIETLHQGASDYVIKSRLGTLAPAVKRALQEANERGRRSQAEADLTESEERFRKMAESALDGLLIIDESELVIYLNRAAKEMFGYSGLEAFDRPLRELLAPEAYSEVFRLGEGRFRESGQGPLIGRTLELSALRKGGEEFPVEVSISSMAIGGQWHVAAIVRDITDRKRDESAQHRLNRKLQAISNCNQALLRAGDEQTLLNDICQIVCGDAGYRMAWVGYAVSDDARTVRPVAWAGAVDGYLAVANISWADTEHGRGPSGRAIRSGEIAYIQDFATDPQMALWRESALQRGYRSSIALPLVDGGAGAFGALTIYAEAPNAFTPDEILLLKELSGDLAFGIAALRTRAERKRAESALAASEREFRALAENAPDNIARYDRECRILYANPGLEAHLGIDARSLLGRTPVEVAPDGRFADYQARIAAVIETGQPGDIELTQPDNGAGVRHHHVRVVAERGAQGEIVGALAIGRDITERKEAELRLQDTERVLETSRAQLRQLASHLEAAREEERRRIARELHDELGQQLVGLRIAVNLLDVQFGQDQPRIRETTAQLRLLVDKTIQITRNVSSSLRPAVLDMGIVPALEWLVAEFSQQTGIPCGLNVPQGDVPLCEERAITVFRIAQESLTNAARHSKAERIEIAFEREAEAHVIEIKDNGVGFDATGPRKLKSFGLVGIRERALAVGGDVIISSTPGLGTTVQVRIPIAEAGVGES